MEYSIIGILSIGFLLIVNSINQLRTDLARMNSTLNKIAKQVGVPEPSIANELRALVAEGKRVQAIKKARMTLGLGLKEAKEYVDDLCEGHNV